MTCHNIDVLYSLFGINRNLDRILYDSIFTRCLTLIRSSSNMHIYSLTDEMLDRFCVAILSKIHHKIEELTVETLSMERVFLVDNYSDLHKLELVSIRLEELERQFDVIYFNDHDQIDIPSNEHIQYTLKTYKNT
ncbi:unnamed protein product [Rotaria sp. Silwood1]|nr:unnamed protein product [Rotaria sp. Silwood1]